MIGTGLNQGLRAVQAGASLWWTRPSHHCYTAESFLSEVMLEREWNARDCPSAILFTWNHVHAKSSRLLPRQDTDNRPILCCHKTMQPCAETGCSALCAVVAMIDLVMNVFGDTFDNAYYSVQLSLGMIKKMPKLRKKEDEEHDVEEAIPVEEQGDGCCYNTWINLFYYAIYGTILHGCTAAIFIVFLYLTQISTHNDAALWFNFCLFVVVVGAIGIGLIMGDAGMKEEALQEKLTSMRLELARSKRKLEAAERERADE